MIEGFLLFLALFVGVRVVLLVMEEHDEHD